MTALQLTVAINDPALCAEPLVKAGADTSLKNEDGYTALDYAKQSNNVEAVRLLENATQIAAATAGLSLLPITVAAAPFTSPLPPPPPPPPPPPLLLLVSPEMSPPPEMSSEISISPEMSLEISPESSQMRWLKGELQQVSPTPELDSSPETQEPPKSRFGRRLLSAVRSTEAQMTTFEI